MRIRIMLWSTPFNAHGTAERQDLARTLLDAAKHIQRLSAAAQRRPEWQIAGRILIAHAEIAIRKALDLPAPPR